MPRYFFNIYDGRNLFDDMGTDLPTLDRVREEAVRFAGELLRDGVRVDFWSGEDWKLVVNDEQGLNVFTLRFSASQPAR